MLHAWMSMEPLRMLPEAVVAMRDRGTTRIRMDDIMLSVGIMLLHGSFTWLAGPPHDAETGEGAPDPPRTCGVAHPPNPELRTLQTHNDHRSTYRGRLQLQLQAWDTNTWTPSSFLLSAAVHRKTWHHISEWLVWKPALGDKEPAGDLWTRES